MRVFLAVLAGCTCLSLAAAYGPAGLEVDVRGAGTCTVAKLEAVGPSACPADSRIGFPCPRR